MTGSIIYSKDQEKKIRRIYGDLSQVLGPRDIIDKILISRMAKCVWKLQRIDQIEEAHLENEMIKLKNEKKSMALLKDSLELNFPQTKQQEEIPVQQFGSDFSLLMRYEISTENRFLRFLSFYENRKRY